MTAALIPFAYQDRLVRSMMRQGEPWFVAKDEAVILGYRDAPNMVRMLDDDEKGYSNLSILGGEQEMLVINESGLYCAVVRSRRPEAKPFRKWVTGEVLPALRRTGSYTIPGARVEAQRGRSETLERLIRFDADNVPERLATLAAHLPIWSNGRRPAFWGDIEVREHFTAFHRQMTIEQARAICASKFGLERTPSASAVHRYWQKLDQVRGIGPDTVPQRRALPKTMN